MSEEFKDIAPEEVAVTPALAVEKEPEVVEQPKVVSTSQVKAAPVEPVKSKNSEPAAQVKAAVSSDAKVVSLSALKVQHTTNSASVALVQDKLIAKGFLDAGSDNRGTYGEGTRSALIKFCGCKKDNCDATCSKEDIVKRLFSGDTVQVIQ